MATENPTEPQEPSADPVAAILRLVQSDIRAWRILLGLVAVMAVAYRRTVAIALVSSLVLTAQRPLAFEALLP
ncbi:MAG TPA: hypothetical protein VK507_13070 [Iamia sp.]|nr:hypothetical protein [Iamia sp.]